MTIGNKVDILITLVEKELKSKYKRTLLGYIWSILNPLIIAMILYIAFQEIMRFKIENYSFYLIVGLFVWQWTTVTINNSMFVYIHNSSLIKKTNFDNKLLPLSITVTETLHFLFSLPVLILISILSLNIKYNHWLLIPLVLFNHIILLYGVTLIVSTLNSIFRDIERLVNVSLQILFYSSPIIYPIDIIPDKYQILIQLNPLTWVIESWHFVFIDTVSLEKAFVHFFKYTIISIIALITGLYIHNKLKYRMVEDL